MASRKNKNGITLLVRRFTNDFEIDENINYYSFNDFLKARRKYVKFMLDGSRKTVRPQQYSCSS